MWSCDRRLFLTFLSALPLAACGFSPVYAPGGAGARLLNRVEIPEPATRPGYLLVRKLEQRLGRATTPDFRLALELDLDEETLAVTPNSVASRFQLAGVLGYSLTDQDTEQVVASGQVENFTGYSATGSTVATQAAARDAEERLITILADQLTTRLIADIARIGA